MSSESVSSDDSFYSVCSTTPIVDIIEDVELDPHNNAVAESLPATFLRQYVNRMKNLIFYYKIYEIDDLHEFPNFFIINFMVFLFIKTHPNAMNEFINDYVKRHDLDKHRISSSFEMLRHFLENRLVIENENISIATNVKPLNADFDKFLRCLIDEDLANQTGIENFDLEVFSVVGAKRSKSKQEFAEAFIIFVLDMTAHVVFLDEERPVIELKIYILDTKFGHYDHEIIYAFSNYKDCEISSTSSNCNEDSSNEFETASESSNPSDGLLLNSDIPAVSSKSSSSEQIINSIEERIEMNHESSLDQTKTLLSTPTNNELKETNISSPDKEKLKKYYPRIRSRFELNEIVSRRHLAAANLKKTSIWLIILKILFSLPSLSDMTSDILLAYKFFQMDQIIFSILTISILIIVGIISIIFERRYYNAYKKQSNYLPNFLNKAPVRSFCSFLQLSAFLGNLKIAIMSIKNRKEKRVKKLLKLLCQNNIVAIQNASMHLKYIETYFEALPQTLLQIYIILTTEKWVLMQLISIASGMVNINLTSLNFLAFFKTISLTNIWRHPLLILRIVCYNGSLITSNSLLFWQFHWIFGTLRIGLLVFISYFSTIDNDFKLKFMNRKVKQFKYLRIFNKITLVDNVIICCILILRLDQLKDYIFLALFVCQMTFSIIWILLIVVGKFDFIVNVMHIQYFLKDIPKNSS